MRPTHYSINPQAKEKTPLRRRTTCASARPLDSVCLGTGRGGCHGETRRKRVRRKENSRIPTWVAGHPAGMATRIAVLLLATVAAAQQGTRDLGDTGLEDLAKIQVYSASRHLQNTAEAPASVSIVTAEQIQEYGYRTLADILRTVPGFYVTYDRNYSFVGVRGVGRLGDWNSLILVMVDGHRMNNNIFDEAMVGTEFQVDVDLIERVEIILGPSSSLYGTNAFLAVINVITRKRQDLNGVEVSAEAGSFNSYKGRASYGGSFKGVDMVLSATFYDSQGQTLFFPEFNSPATNNGIVRHSDDEAYKHILATFSFQGFTLQGVFSQREKGTPTAYFGTVFNDPRTRNFDGLQYFNLGYHHALGGKWMLSAQTSYDQQRLQAPLSYSAGPVDVFSTRGDWWSGEVKVNRTWEKHALTFGSEVRDNLRQDEADYIAANNTFVQDRSSSRFWALYAQDEFAITPTLTLNAGLRYDHYSSFGGTANPRVALIYHPRERTTFKFLYGSAFRAPELFETQPDFGAAYDDNLKLGPERVHSGEFVAEQGLGPHFKLSGTFFRNEISDLISLVPNPLDRQLIYRNAGQIQATGTEIQFAGTAASGLQGKVSFSYVDAENVGNGNLGLSNSPHEMGKADVSAPFFRRRLVASLDAQYTSSRTTLAGNTVSGFGVLNGTLLGHALGKHIDISASVYNLLDKKYFDPGRPEDTEDRIQQDGRNFRIKITGRF